jgi:hypothetical protein
MYLNLTQEPFYHAGVQYNMVTDCFGARAFSFSETEAVFLQGSLSLMKLIIPGVIGFLLWRFYATEKERVESDVSILRLNEPQSENQRAESYFSTESLFALFLCAMAAVVTFTLGLLSVRAYEHLR